LRSIGTNMTRAAFSTIVIDRGNRQGFPVAVKSDLRILQEYFLHTGS
jgi:hypothetical protein